MRDHWQVLLWQRHRTSPTVFPAEQQLVPKALWRR